MENNILLDGNAQFILLVGVITTLLTLVLLTTRLLDRRHADWVRNDREKLKTAGKHIVYLSWLTRLQLIVAGIILVRILVSPWCTNLFWFDWVIIAILFFVFVGWICVHEDYFRRWYRFKENE